MKLSRANLAVRGVASTDKSMPALNRVHVAVDGSTVASNGRMLMAVSPAGGRALDAFPRVEVDEASPDPNGVGVGMSLRLVGDALRNWPKDRKRDSLQFAQITRCDPGEVELMTTDGARKKKVNDMPMRGTFPAWGVQLRGAKKRAVLGRICVNRRDLIRILEAVQEACPDPGEYNPVFLEFGGPEDAIVIRSENIALEQSVVGMLNPLDTDGAWLEESLWEKRIGRDVGKKKKQLPGRKK